MGSPYAGAGAHVVFVGCASTGMTATTVTPLATNGPPLTVAIQ
jgi:hypothetical protein